MERNVTGKKPEQQPQKNQQQQPYQTHPTHQPEHQLLQTGHESAYRSGEQARERARDGGRGHNGGSLGEAYTRTSQAIQSGYNRTLEYGRAYPARMGLMTFAAGIGLGMVIAVCAFPRRTRTERLAGPWIDAAADLARYWAWRRR